MKPGEVYHLASAEKPGRPECGASLTKWVSPLPTNNEDKVNCPECLAIIDSDLVITAPVSRHLAKVLDWREAMCGHVMTPDDRLPTSNEDVVTCKDCLNLMSRRAEVVHYIHRKVQWHKVSSAPYACGAMGGTGVVASSSTSSVTCTDCLNWMRGVGAPTPQHRKPPRMEDANGLVDGVFEFYDVDLGEEATMEVVPMTTGNVEITVGLHNEGVVFTLSHLDRADLLRALLHDFHYSPERGGPSDDND